jgi:hypothetical protein
MENLLPLVGLFSLHLFVHLFCREMEANLIRMFVPANGGGAIIDRRWIDERGNPTSYKITVWVGQPPFGGA